MIESLVIIHRMQDAKGQVRALSLPKGPWLLWKTCLRQLAIGFHEAGTGPLNFNLALSAKGGAASKAARTQIYYGEDAYQFILEVVCGLHSPMIGETEVAGQFKELLDGLERPAETAFGHPILNSHDKSLFQRLFSQVLSDAKQVRQNHLLELGSRSYGSLLRKHVSREGTLNFIGAGHLVREIVPWLYKQVKETHVFCRRPMQAQLLANEYQGLKVHKIPSEALSFGLSGVVVVAAPIESHVLHYWFKDQTSRITQVIDLRDTASSDVLDLSVPVIKLHDLFEELALVEKDTQARVNQAKATIAELTQKRGRAAENRPFGWEDLCG